MNMLSTGLCMSDIYRALDLDHACVARSLLQVLRLCVHDICKDLCTAWLFASNSSGV